MVDQLLITLTNSVLGTGKPTSRGNYAYHCPFCKHHKPKLEVNFTENKNKENPWQCWVCLNKGKRLINLFKKIHAPKDKIQELNSLLKINYQIGEQNHANEQITLPKEFISLINNNNLDIIGRHALAYLKSRGFNENDIIKYNLGYCDKGKYEKRIIIPSYDNNGNINYFTARSFDKFTSKKYDNPPISRNIIPFEFFINWSSPIILCEGSLDAMTIKRNAIPLLGKNIQENLLKKIVESKVKKIYIALDKDALKISLKHCEYLMNEGKQVYLIELDKKDPNELGFIEFTKILHKAKQLTFSKLLEKKLQIL